MKPLEGVKVLSLTHYLQGPSCVQFLADLGADVVKVERIGGGFERKWSGARTYLANRTSVFFLLAGRNQRSIELDFRKESGRAVLWSLIESSDVLVENFRPGTLAKYGLSFEEVEARNPRLVYCSLSGYGPDGPNSMRPGQDLLVQSESGMAWLTGREQDPPMPVGSAMVDQHAATLGALGILAALIERGRTGKGMRVDSNLLSAALDLQIEPFNYYLNGGELWDRSASGVSTRFHQAPYGTFATADGWLTVSLTDGATLAKAFSDPEFEELTGDDQFSKREEINTRVASLLRADDTQTWERILKSNGVWCARVQTYDEVVADPQLEANGSVIDYVDASAGPVRLLAHPIRYNKQVPIMERTPPSLGQHTTEVLRELGYDDAAIDTLRQEGVLGS